MNIAVSGCGGVGTPVHAGSTELDLDPDQSVVACSLNSLLLALGGSDVRSSNVKPRMVGEASPDVLL